MRNDGQKPQGPTGRANGLIPSSFRAISSYLRIVSSGASAVASTVRSAASSIVDRDEDARYDQVLWAGFDKLECARDVVRRVLLLGYRSGFQVWDVEEAHNVHVLVSRHDGPASFLQMLPQPLSTLASCDGFSGSRPLLVVCTTRHRFQDGLDAASNGGIPRSHDPGNAYHAPSTVQFYSLTSQSYVHILKFRSVVYSVRCSRRVVAVSQAAQVHCFNAATLEMEYTILTNPVVTVGPGSGGIACGALALGPRWLAYSGSPLQVSNEVHICPQHLIPSGTFPSTASNGCVAQYAKESSKHLNTGYKKVSRYCSELLPNSNYLEQSTAVGRKANGTTNGLLVEVEGDNVGMVIVKDVVSKVLMTQFRAHKSPISALSFDPSGILLATASVHGHNVNVFRIIPERTGGSGASRSYVHLYRLQRGLTDAIIRDITFSDDCRWIMISSSRGTSHLFAISPSGGTANLSESNGSSVKNNPAVQWKSKPADQMLKQNPFSSGPPVTLSAVSRIRNGVNGWRGAMNGAAAVTIGKNNSLSGAIAAAFHLYKDSDMHINTSSTLTSKQHLLVFSPSGCLIQYALRVPVELSVASAVSPTYESAPGNDSKLLVEAIQKWNINQKQRDQEDNFDIYGENRSLDAYRLCQDASRNGYGICPVVQCTKVTGSKMSSEERNHFFVSEAELRMHKQVPLWMRSEIYFQLMTAAMKLDGENAGGEIEIEKIPTSMIEARTKNLVPVFDYLVDSKPQPSSKNGQEQPQGSGVFPNGSLSFGGGFDAVGSLSGKNGPMKFGYETMGSVNTHVSPSEVSQAQFVNNTNTECCKMDIRLKVVNNNSEA